MAQFETMRCFVCGEGISNKYEAFEAMREALLAHNNPEFTKHVHADNKTVYPAPQENIEVIFDTLHLNKQCCRMHIANAIPLITLK
jgi:DNA-directed RNA polymerase subunit N (RpoN/RPB10)